MSNKFQTSVQERMDQEAARQSQQTESPPKDNTPSQSGSDIKLGEDISQAELDAYMRNAAQRTAKNKTFYLDGQVIDAIKAAAKTYNITESKLVNDILKLVLIRE